MLHRCLAQEIIIQLDYSVAKGEALRLYRFAYFAHDGYFFRLSFAIILAV
jgi:hypothetical protein